MNSLYLRKGRKHGLGMAPAAVSATEIIGHADRMTHLSAERINRLVRFRT